MHSGAQVGAAWWQVSCNTVFALTTHLYSASSSSHVWFDTGQYNITITDTTLLSAVAAAWNGTVTGADCDCHLEAALCSILWLHSMPMQADTVRATSHCL